MNNLLQWLLVLASLGKLLSSPKTFLVETKEDGKGNKKPVSISGSQKFSDISAAARAADEDRNRIEGGGTGGCWGKGTLINHVIRKRHVGVRRVSKTVTGHIY